MRLVLAALLLIAAPARGVDAPETDLWVVTSAQVTSGSARFVTSLRILDPGAAAASVTLKFLPQTDVAGAPLADNTGGPSVNVSVDAGHTLVIDDVIGTKFGSAAVAGGIHVTSDVPVVVMSQTLNVNAQSASGVAGTYGFAIPAQTLDNAVGIGETAWVPYVSGSPTSSSGYRTNLFLLSGNAGTATGLHVKLVRSDGSTVGEGDYQLGKLAQTQINGVASVFGSFETDLTAVVTVSSGGPVFLGASVIDNAISSVLYTPPTKLWRPRNAAYGLILDDGGYGFSGRLDVVNGVPAFLSAELVLEGCPAASGPLPFFVQLGPAYGNGTFTASGDGAFTLSGTMKASDGSVAATVTGSLLFGANGLVTGEIVYTRSTNPGNQCGGVTKTFPLHGRKVIGLGST